MADRTASILSLLRASTDFAVFIGRAVCMVFARLFGAIYRLFLAPVLFFRAAGRSVRSGVRREWGTRRLFTGRILRALKTLTRMLKTDPRALPKLCARYAAAARATYRPYLKTLRLTALPLCAAALLLLLLAGLRDRRPGLEIYAGDLPVGVAASEGDFLRAKAAVQAQLRPNGEPLWKDLRYRVTLAPLNGFSDETALAERLLALADVETIPACGVYIDGVFLCAVQNENDAKAVFDAILYANVDATAAAARFRQQVTYRQGRYPAGDDTLWTRSRLASYLNALPPEKAMHVQITKTQTQTVPLDYQTVSVETDALDRGENRVLVEGQTGADQITRLITLLDGREVDSRVLRRATLRLPVDERVQVGTRDPAAAQADPAQAEAAPAEEAPAPEIVETPLIYYPIYSNYPVYSPADFGGLLVWPAVGATNLNSDFEFRWGKMHEALDIGTAGEGSSLGKTVVAAAAGTVVIAGVHSSYGCYVKIDHGNGMETLYAHCLEDSLLVEAGDYVQAGQPIARIGMTGYATGPHLHFEVIIYGTRVDPKPYLGIG